MAIYGLLSFMQARGEAAQPFSVEVFVNGESAGTRAFTAASMTAPDPIILSVPANAGTNQVRIVKKDAGTVYWSAAANYYDTATADARHGTYQLALTRKYSLLTPVTVRNRIVYRETPFSGTANPGDVLTVRLTAAGSPEWRYLALEDPLPAGVEAIQRHQRLSAREAGAGCVVVRLARRVPRFAHGVLPGDLRARSI